MKRKTFDLLVSGGAMLLAGLLVLIGLVLSSNATFTTTYVAEQLRRQRITFPSADALTAVEARAACLRTYAGRALTTGKQAECYANEYIALHLRTNTQTGGRTYAELGAAQAALRAQITGVSSEDPNLPRYQRSLADLSAARETVFQGETLRGLLLTTYGFSIFGDKARQAAVAVGLLAIVLAMLATFGFMHGLVIREDLPLDHLHAQPEPGPYEGVPVHRAASRIPATPFPG